MAEEGDILDEVLLTAIQTALPLTDAKAHASGHTGCELGLTAPQTECARVRQSRITSHHK